jgi:hypothetical protein
LARVIGLVFLAPAFFETAGRSPEIFFMPAIGGSLSRVREPARPTDPPPPTAAAAPPRGRSPCPPEPRPSG